LVLSTELFQKEYSLCCTPFFCLARESLLDVSFGFGICLQKNKSAAPKMTTGLQNLKKTLDNL